MRRAVRGIPGMDGIRLLPVAADRGLALPIGVAVALLWANGWPNSYFSFAHAWSFAVNDVAMVFFFALITAEIVEATSPGGALDTWRRAALPVVGAVGGIVGAGVVYMLYLRVGDESSVLLRAWPVPAVADITFGYVMARAICRRHPAMPFFLLLVIASDAIGVVFVEVRYPVADGHAAGLLLLTAAIGLASGLRRLRVASVWLYISTCGPLSWWGLFLAGLHPALALVPIMPFLMPARRGRPLLGDAPARARDGLGRFDRAWKCPVQIVLLLFALVNAGVAFRGVGTGTWAVAIASLVGKPLGVLAAVGLAVASGLRLPQRVGWRELVVVSLLASIGFTFALFVATAAIPVGPILVEAKLGALLTIGGAFLARGAARVLKVGRFARSSLPQGT